MISFKTKKKTVESALGVHVLESTARKIDEILKTLPKDSAFRYRRKSGQVTELIDGERADISLVSTEAIDRDNEKVVATGIDLSEYQLNPVVLWNHNYEKPCARCGWIKAVNGGVKAKTIYPEREPGYEGEWLPEYCYQLVKADVLRAKSIGFIPLKIRDANNDEREKGCELVIEESLVLEYSLVAVPANPLALVESVKGMTFEKIGSIKRKPMAKTKRLDFRFDSEEIAREVIRKIQFRGEV